MELIITSHAIERSLERLNMTGVQLYRHLKQHIQEKHLKYEKPRAIHVGGIKVVIKENTIITVYPRFKVVGKLNNIEKRKRGKI